MFDDDQRLAVEQALPGSPAKSVVQTDKKGTRRPQGLPRRGDGQVQPGPHRPADPGPHLRRRGRADAQRLRRRLVDDPRRQGARGRAERPARAHRRRGLRRARHLRRRRSRRRPSRASSEMGLTYNRFHVTAVCSPTRAALLTGRNQHRVGFGSIAEYPGPFPGYTGSSPRAAPPCRASSRRTATSRAASASGTSRPNTSRARPARSTTGPSPGASTTGGASCPALPASTTRSSPRTTGSSACPRARTASPYYFPDDITDKSIEWLHAVRAQDAAQALVHVLLDRLRPRPAPRAPRSGPTSTRAPFDDGWDKLPRADVRAPEGARDHPAGRRADRAPGPVPGLGLARTTPRRSSTPARWRCTPATRRTPTGTSAACSTRSRRWATSTTRWSSTSGATTAPAWRARITGSFNELTFLNGLVLDAEQQLELIEQYGGLEALGGDHTAPHFAAAWAHAVQHARSSGASRPPATSAATRDPMVVAWPSGSSRTATLRTQFTHCIDVGPDDPRGGRASRSPTTVDGIAQEPMDGTSFLYTFDDASAPRSGTRSSTSRCSAAARCTRTAGGPAPRPDQLPWDFSPATLAAFGPGRRLGPRPGRRWELYYLPDDFSQARDLAAEHPDKVAELQELWWQEAERNRALPLLGGILGPLRHPAAAADADPLHLRRRRAEHPAR